MNAGFLAPMHQLHACTALGSWSSCEFVLLRAAMDLLATYYHHISPQQEIPNLGKKWKKKRIEADCTPTEIWVRRPFLQLLHCNLSVQIWPCPSTLFHIPPKTCQQRVPDRFIQEKEMSQFFIGISHISYQNRPSAQQANLISPFWEFRPGDLPLQSEAEQLVQTWTGGKSVGLFLWEVSQL